MKRRSLMALGAWVAVGFGGGAALAQYRLPADGGLFDANPQLGSGGRNVYQRQVPALLGGNALTEGQVRRGLSFRGYSPIPDPYEFRGSLGSSSLTNFRRDSFSVANTALPEFGFGGPGGLAAPRFNQSSTVPTVGFLRGQTTGVTGYRQGMARPNYRTPYVPSGARLSPGDRPLTGFDRQRDDLDAMMGGLPFDASNQFTQPPSSIFGVGVPRRAERDFLPGRELRDPTPNRPGILNRFEVGEDGLERRQVDEMGPGAAEPGVGFGLSGRRMDAILGVPPQDAGAEMDPTALGPRGRGLAELVRTGGYQRRALDPTGADGQGADQPAGGPRIQTLPGADVYGDLQMANALQREPGADWFQDMQAVREATGVTEKLEPEELVARLNRPLTSFVGEQENPLNATLAEAEALMANGEYFAAARRYESASMLAPANPLPLLGRANALLAAGEYETAAVALVQALERNVTILSQVTFDLEQMLGGGEIVDVRRSDLRQRLENAENPRLRFLLGYLEYFGGQPERGLENLKQAGDAAGVSLAIRRYVDLLTREQPAVEGVN
jgi:predicted secreted protein